MTEEVGAGEGAGLCHVWPHTYQTECGRAYRHTELFTNHVTHLRCLSLDQNTLYLFVLQKKRITCLKALFFKCNKTGYAATDYVKGGASKCCTLYGYGSHLCRRGSHSRWGGSRCRAGHLQKLVRLYVLHIHMLDKVYRYVGICIYSLQVCLYIHICYPTVGVWVNIQACMKCSKKKLRTAVGGGVMAASVLEVHKARNPGYSTE